MTEFIDEVLLFNAEAWDNNMPYLGASGVGQKWTRDLAVKVPSCSKNTQKPKDQKPFQPQQKFQNREKNSFRVFCVVGTTSKFARNKTTTLAPPLGALL